MTRVVVLPSSLEEFMAEKWGEALRLLEEHDLYILLAKTYDTWTICMTSHGFESSKFFPVHESALPKKEQLVVRILESPSEIFALIQECQNGSGDDAIRFRNQSELVRVISQQIDSIRPKSSIAPVIKKLA